ncbi:DoxX family protein [Planctomycetes bacterium TBK1r]|uniref:DoxX n=1 Tax=Stieleria magnilauensis TaxID=2527963 RepID=A0ABX5XHE2_9BACT|nr:hypothetical protein TBK1r_03200 [Planctomycetes bacterium TBK1r]
MRNILLTPLRLAVGWGISPRILGIIAITMLVLLRLSIGWHFHSEGSEKYRKGDWDAAPFFANAKGPLAEEFRKTVWDYDGKVRRDPEFTRWWLEQYRDRAADYYTFGEKELAVANEALEKVLEDHQVVLEDYADDLEEYDLGQLRLEMLKSEEDRVGVESLAGQIETVERENDAKLKPALAAIDELWAGYEGTINSLAAPNQRRASPPLDLVKPRTAVVDTSVINRYVPYFDLAVGWCLLLGLFTPVAALAAAGFLGSVFLSQYPPGTGPSSSNYQLIECMACLVLASTGAGRFAGLDFFIHLFIRRSVAKHAADK